MKTFSAFLASIFALVAITLASPVPSAQAALIGTSIVTQTYTTVGATAALVLSRDLSRTYLSIQNQGTSTVFIKFGSTVGSTNDGITLTSGSTYEPRVPPNSAVYMKSPIGAQVIGIISGR